jgi:ribosomal protein S18 acetylase RimI-like enzyme
MPAIALDDVTVNNVGALKTINEYTLPTTYSEEFYSDAHANKFVQLGFYGEIAVGAIKAKPIVPQHHTTPTSVYIESIAVLEAYRGNGIGKKLVEYIIEKTKESYIHEVSLHVWKKESKVIEWYQKQGFEVVKEIEGYYKDHGLEDPDAVFMVKKF